MRGNNPWIHHCGYTKRVTFIRRTVGKVGRTQDRNEDSE